MCVYLPGKWLNGKQTKTTRISQIQSNFKILELNIKFFSLMVKVRTFLGLFFAIDHAVLFMTFAKHCFYIWLFVSHYLEMGALSGS